ncbi:MAG: hypothetical protein V1655_00325 [bacterium]
MFKAIKNKEGSILIMSLLILSGLLISGISVGIIVLNQLKQSKNLDFSIIAYYAADSATENALYYFRKGNRTAQYLNAFENTGVFDNTAQWEREIASTTPYNALLRQNRPVLINLYDSEADCGLVKCVRYNWNDLTAGESGPDLEVTYYPWEIAGSITVLPEKGEQEYYTSPLTPGPWTAYNQISLLNNTCYSIRVQASYDDANVEIKTFSDAVCTQQIGIPSFLTIDSLGKFNTAKQRIKTYVLKDAPLSNVFEFVIFSEETIQK